MDFTLLTSKSAHLGMQCARCKNYLSVFPIAITPENQNICGRCITSPDYNRNNVYEAVSQFIEFPCRYHVEGCTEEILPREMADHERNCQFRLVLCPTSSWTGCPWEGCRTNSIHHCQAQHYNFIVDNTAEFTVDLRSSQMRFNLIEHDGIMLIVEQNFHADKQRLDLAVYNCPTEGGKTYCCQLSVKSGKRSFATEFQTSTSEDKKFMRLFVWLLGDTQEELHSVVSLLTVGKVVRDSEPQHSGEMSELLSVLKCCGCDGYVLPPVYQCFKTSSSVCSECLNKHLADCTDKNILSHRRFINIDKMANLLNYPCKNFKFGCTFVAKPETLTSHLDSCKYTVCQCPLHDFLNCQWQDRKDLLTTHIRESHSKHIVTSPEISKLVNLERLKCDVIPFGERFFVLFFVKVGDKYCWSVRALGADDQNFKFEIEIVGPNRNGKRLLVRQSCAPFVKRSEIFKDPSFYCYFMKDQLCNFLSGQGLTFRIHILKSFARKRRTEEDIDC